MLRPIWTGLITIILLIQGAGALEVTFRAQDGDGSAELSSRYDVDNDVTVFEQAAASMGIPAITDSRSISGTGQVSADQSYSGSCGYSGEASYYSKGSGALTGSANLNPESMSTSQDASVGGSGYSYLIAEDSKGNWAGVYTDVEEGSLSASQKAWTGSADADSTVHSSGKSTTVEAVAFDPLHESDAYSELHSKDGVSARFDGSVNACAGLSTDAEILSRIQGGLYSFVGAGTLQGPDSMSRRDSTDKLVNADQHLHAHTSLLAETVDDMTFYAGGQFKIQPAIDTARSGETINVNPGIYYENPVIDKSLTIQGAGSVNTIVDGCNPIDPQKASVFTVDPGVNARLSGMTIHGGIGTYYADGDARLGGGIYNIGTLTLDSCTISGNSADLGGGIINWGTITVNDGMINSNTAKHDGGGIDNQPDGIINLNDGTISGNSATYGGGIINWGTTTVNGGIISGNSAEYGGGILNYFGTTNLNPYQEQKIAIKKNSASGVSPAGGGIYNYGGEISPGYSNCDFGTGADANIGGDHN